MRLLLVEDEKRMAQALCEILRQEKYEVDQQPPLIMIRVLPLQAVPLSAQVLKVWHRP